MTDGSPTSPEVRAIRAWVRLDEAFQACSATLVREYGVSGAQLAMLRLIAEWGGTTPLAELRQRLSMHPATIGQICTRLAARGHVTVTTDPTDRRRRTVALTTEGRALLDEAPLVGPVRLRHVDADPAVLERLRATFDEALDMFGLAPYAQKEKPCPSPPRSPRSQATHHTTTQPG